MKYPRYRSRPVIAGAVGLTLVAAAGLLTATTAQAATGCGVSYAVSSSWQGGFGANVTITNLGDPVTSWKLTWSFTAGQTITQLWNGSLTQSGAQVTVTNAAYNGAIRTNGTAAFGFNGTWNGSNPTPTGFTLNGTPCTGAIDGSSSSAGNSSSSGGQSSSSSSQSSSSSSSSSQSSSSSSAPPVSYPIAAGYETSSSLPNHTIYRPNTLPAEALPIFVWGEGGCSNNGTSSQPFLQNIASYGFLVIANGNPNGSGTETSAQLTQAIDWAVSENSRQGSKYYGKVNTSKVAVAGWSCGGLEAYEVSNDSRVTTTMIFSSGLLDDNNDYQLKRLTKPIAYFIGGSGDIAYANAMDDWGKLPSGLPAWMGNLPVGHGGTYTQTNGGEFGRVAVLYLQWRLKGNTTSGTNFVGSNCGLCRNTQWTVQQKNLTL